MEPLKGTWPGRRAAALADTHLTTS